MKSSKNISNTSEPMILFTGDIVVFTLSLWLMLFFRNFSLPSGETYLLHFEPFIIIFVTSVFIFFVAGLYERHTMILRSRMPAVIFQSQLINSTVAVIFFYFVPYFGITPKTNLFIYLLISLILIVLWRLWIYPFLLPRKKKKAILIGAGREVDELVREVNNDPQYELSFIHNISFDNKENDAVEAEIRGLIDEHDVSLIVIDLDHPVVKSLISKFYDLIFQGIEFVPMYKVYEDVFERIPYSALHHDWFMENISLSMRTFYRIGKRFIDILIAFVAGIISLIFYPFVWIAIKLDDKGPVFITQERIGMDGKKIEMVKFRSMKSIKGDAGKWLTQDDDRITRVGRFLRKSRIDELPQLWNVLVGDLSLIGPRPDIFALGKELSAVIPYYGIRNLTKPGLSGWAQIKQDLPPQSLEETELRLAYDIYYVKNRSFFLDIKIIIKTIRTLLSRSGR